MNESNSNIPDLLGALILKAAAYASDNRDRGRHLEDAALLLSLIDDPVGEKMRMHGSDSRRLRKLSEALGGVNAEAWLQLPIERRQQGQDNLKILCGSD